MCQDRVHVASGVLVWQWKYHHNILSDAWSRFALPRLQFCTEIMLARIEVITLTGDSISMIPRQLSRFLKSPFFGKIFNLLVSHSASHSPVSQTWRIISWKRFSVDSSADRTCQNSTWIFESPAALSFLAEFKAFLTRSRVDYIYLLEMFKTFRALLQRVVETICQDEQELYVGKRWQFLVFYF